MKTLQILILTGMVFLLPACSDQLDQKEASAVVEDLLQEIDKENYNNLSEYYTESFNSGESEEARAAKFDQLRKGLGSLKSMEMQNAENIAEFAEPSKIILTYRIERTRVPSIEKFVVVKEDGEYKVANHSITNE